ncbi:MAG: sugar-binding domain-containing protein [Acidimicrobiales bacterium]
MTPSADLLCGRPGTDGFLFHDGFGQPVHRAAPGLLGLLEGRAAMQRWKPALVAWLDDRDHFFDHLLREFGDEAGFEPMLAEVAGMRHADVPAATRSRLLFRYLTDVAGEVERAALSSPAARARARPWTTAVVAGPGPASHSLNGRWRAYYRRGPGDYATAEMDVPVNWELVPGIESYAGTMRFTRVVRVPARLRGRRLVVRFSGVDYFADLWVDGHHVGGHEGYFGPFELDVSPFVAYGRHTTLRLAVTSPNDPAGEGISVASGWDDFRPSSSFPNRKTMVKGALGHHDAKRGGAWSSLTSQDGNTGGVWNDVALDVRDPVHLLPVATRVTTLDLTPMAAEDGYQAAVRLSCCVRNTTGEVVDGRLAVVVRPANFEGQGHRMARDVVLHPGDNQIVVEGTVSPVRAWEPWDQGFPHLYAVTASVRVGGRSRDAQVLQTGFRVLSVTPEGESPGVNGALVVNGHQVFVRGTNVLPTYWLSEYDADTAARDFRMLREAGFNTVLVHTLVAPRVLYDLADSHGFLVVQMFPLQWSYEQSDELVARAARQVGEMTALLANHPSVVSYEMHNEPDMRTAPGLDNRRFDFDLHALVRDHDRSRWASTFSGGNHAYPGQFYELRDDNGFATLPARFMEAEFEDRRFSRHPNMPTEFGIQAMPNEALFRRILSEGRVRAVLRRLHSDPAWVAGGGDDWPRTSGDLDAITEVVGGGSWEGALAALDWAHLPKMGALEAEIEALARDGAGGGPEALRRRLALLLLEVLHYGGFKGENFWFGRWRPGRTLKGFVAASQDRQYRLHKDAIEHYLNAGVAGPIVGYLSFMWRDPDWQAPAWGVVDAEGVPKKAYRAYLESNQPVRATLPPVLRSPVKVAGDRWLGGPDAPPGTERRPWADAELIVANDTAASFPAAEVKVWLEEAGGAAVQFVDRAGAAVEVYSSCIDLDRGSGRAFPTGWFGDPATQPVVPDGLGAGTYLLRAAVNSAGGERLSTNTYELVVLDTGFAWLDGLAPRVVGVLLHGGPDAVGFRFWDRGRVVHSAAPGVRGLLAGFESARTGGVDLYDTIQGEHLLRHVLAELDATPEAAPLLEALWKIRSEVLSPTEKTAVAIRYLGLFAERAEAHLEAPAAKSWRAG